MARTALPPGKMPFKVAVPKNPGARVGLAKPRLPSAGLKPKKVKINVKGGF